MKRTTLFLAGAALLASSTLVMAKSDTIKAAITDSGRPEADTKRDDLRKPAAMLAFAGIGPGKVVVDLLPGGGYFTRLFARAVEPGGRVYAYFGVQYDKRLKDQGKDPDAQFTDLKATYKNLGVIHGPLAQFVTPQPADVVWTSDNYHDMHNASYAMDVNEVNKAIFKSLKPGGYYVIIDHEAAETTGDDVTEKLHRIKLSTTRKEVEAAGFKLVAEGKDLVNSADAGTERVFEADVRGKTNQFMLKFQKPRH
ncbi:MAG: methyltransferase [Alphaproteobacteria bacterium]|nr:methyltransferase [Alphaproteobacteria bacterium]